MEAVQYYNVLSIILAVVAFIMLILSVIIWFKLNIRRDFAVLSGSEAKRDIERIRREAQAGTVQADLRMKRQGAAISWNTSESLSDSKKPLISGRIFGSGHTSSAKLSGRMSGRMPGMMNGAMNGSMNMQDDDRTVLLAENQVQQPMQTAGQQAGNYDPNQTVLLSPGGQQAPVQPQNQYSQPVVAQNQYNQPGFVQNPYNQPVYPQAVMPGVAVSSMPDPNATVVLGQDDISYVTNETGFIIEREERT